MAWIDFSCIGFLLCMSNIENENHCIVVSVAWKRTSIPGPSFDNPARLDAKFHAPPGSSKKNR
ncbi:hypothetical protein DVDV_2634 [Desulfovibrio sp. DV]|nr:hypothetical protein DVDV_2634 [Desulfovibrio sp. DV]